MGNALMEREVNYLSNGEAVKLTGNMIKNYLTRGNEAVTDQEVVMFMNLCKFQKLNPFLNECYLVKYKGTPANIITSKEAYMKRAEEHPSFDGFEAGLIVKRQNSIVEIEGAFTLESDALLGAWCRVHRKDRKIPTTVKVSFEEYQKGQATWKSMPKVMIRKVAIVNALREAFPTVLGNLYTEEEAQNEAPHIEEYVSQTVTNATASVTVDLPPEEPTGADF